MTALNVTRGLEEAYEYHGSTAVEWVRKQYGRVEHRWLFFDTVQEASDFYYDLCACEAA